MSAVGWAGGFWGRRGVRARSTITAVVVVAIALAGGGIALVLVLKVSLTSSVQQSVVQRVKDAAAQVGADDIEAVTPILNASPGDATVIQIIDSAGTVVLSSPSIEGEPAIVTGAVPAGEPSTQELPLAFVDNAPYLVAAVAAKSSQGEVTVVAAQSLAQVQKVYGLVAWLLLVGSPFLLAAVGAVTWLAVGRSLTSVDRIRSRVDTIGAADLDERVPVPAAQDEIARLAVTMNHMLDRLESSATTQRQFVADASHELKSPLASMRASLDVAKSIGGGDALVEAEPVLSDEVDRMTRLVADLLLLAKADEGEVQLHRVHVDLDELVAGEARRLRSQTSLTVTTDVEPVQVTADSDRLAQAVRNLVDNASRFAIHDVRLGVHVVDGDAVITIDDDGPGIPSGARDSVMRRFVRLDEHRARQHGGSGLGLAITGEIARLHGGRIAIGDSSLGGAQVSLMLPI